MIAALVLAALCGGETPEPSDWMTDDQGRTFRIGFDPGNRWLFGAAWDFDAQAGEHRVMFETEWFMRASDYDEGVRWKYSHEMARMSATIGEVVRLDGLVYRGEFLRWAKDGKITIPTTPPTRIGFPVDIGVSVEVGRLRTRPESDKWKSEITPIGSELLFDFWRKPTTGSYLVLGVGARYDLWVDKQEAILHVVAPFSHARLTLHHEWCQGKQLFETTIDAMTAWTSKETWADHVGAQMSYEWTFLAINDDPLSLRLAGEWRWDELTDSGAEDGHELRATAGLRLGL